MNMEPINDEPVMPGDTSADAPVDALAVTEGEATVVPTELARIVVKRGGQETADEFTFSPPAVIGRFDPSVGPVDVDLGQIPEGAYVSRKHARISCEDGAWAIEDLGSSNGTFVLRSDFERVERADLEDGTEFALGNARFVFHLMAAEPISDEPEPAAEGVSEAV